MSKLKWPLLILGVMLGEGLVLYFIFPNKQNAANAQTANTETKDTAELAEQEIGKFTVQNTVNQEGPLKIECTVAIGVNKKNKAKFDSDFKDTKFRLNEAVNITMRRADLNAIREPTMTTLKRQLKEALTEVLGRDKDYVQSVYLTEFRATEI